ncbi:MAG: tetratricopeptide repeat protein, partial [Deltaproteobacteria bacterium]|nr:tetratricopeptide repeat protein [Deltaproteobacteria bacterium]
LMVKAGIQERAKKGEIDVVKVDPKKEEAPIPETPLHELEDEYVKAADLYVKLLTELIKDPEVRKKNPQRGEKIPEIMYISAQVFYRHGKFKEAVERLRVLFEYDPQHKFAAYAVFTLLDCYKRLQRWTKVEEWARKLIEAKNFKVKSKKDLEKIVAIAITENAKQLSAEKSYDQATKESLRIYEEFKGDEEMASTALYNAAALLEGQKKVEQAIAMYKRVVKEFPKSKMAPEAVWTIGVIYESQTMFDNAADTFEEMAKFEKAKQTPDALQNAGLIREALGQYKEAIEGYRKFIKMFPQHEDAHFVDFKIGLIYETIGDNPSLKKAHDHYLEFVKKYKDKADLVVEAYSRAGDCLKRIDKVKNRKAVEVLLKNTIDAFNKLGANEKAIEYSKRYAAHAAFELAEYAYDDFSVLKIPSTLDPNVLKKALTAKAEAQLKTEKLYDAVLTYKSAGWTAGALFRKGLLYYDFYKQLMEVPVPECPCPGIPAKDCKAVQNAFKTGDLDTVN